MKYFNIIVLILMANIQYISKDTILNIDLEIKENSKILFGKLIDIATDSKNNIYVLDNKENTIYKYSENGKYLRNIGRLGQGPGEFEKPCSIFLNDKDKLFVLDRNKRRIEIFKNEVYEKTITLKIFPTGNRNTLYIDKNNEIYITGYYNNQNTILAKYSENGEIIRYYSIQIIEHKNALFNKNEQVMINQYLSGGSICINNNDIYIAHSWPNVIEKIDEKGKNITYINKERISLWKPFIFRTNQINGKLFGDSTYSTKILLNNNYLINAIYVVDWEGNNKDIINLNDASMNPNKYFKIKRIYSSIDIYDIKMKYIRNININNKVKILCSDSKGRLLGIKYNDEDVASIVRYRMEK